jgi:hypothetical protein
MFQNQEEFVDTKRVIRWRKTKKNRQHTGQTKKDTVKKRNNDLQNTARSSANSAQNLCSVLICSNLLYRGIVFCIDLRILVSIIMFVLLNSNTTGATRNCLPFLCSVCCGWCVALEKSLFGTIWCVRNDSIRYIVLFNRYKFWYYYRF